MTPYPRGNFHRVVGVVQTGPTSMDLELQTPPLVAGNGVAVVLESVTEVYYRGAN
jgi:hypothetical protein